MERGTKTLAWPDAIYGRASDTDPVHWSRAGGGWNHVGQPGRKNPGEVEIAAGRGRPRQRRMDDAGETLLLSAIDQHGCIQNDVAGALRGGLPGRVARMADGVDVEKRDRGEASQHQIHETHRFRVYLEFQVEGLLYRGRGVGCRLCRSELAFRVEAIGREMYPNNF